MGERNIQQIFHHIHGLVPNMRVRSWKNLLQPERAPKQINKWQNYVNHSGNVRALQDNKFQNILRGWKEKKEKKDYRNERARYNRKHLCSSNDQIESQVKESHSEFMNILQFNIGNHLYSLLPCENCLLNNVLLRIMKDRLISRKMSKGINHVSNSQSSQNWRLYYQIIAELEALNRKNN